MNTLFDRFVSRVVVIAAIALLSATVVFVARVTDRQDAAQTAQLISSSQNPAG